MWGMLAAIQFRIFCHSVSSLKCIKTIILHVVLYGCETWSLMLLTLRNEHRLRVFENKMLRRLFGPKREEVVGGWR